MLIEAAIFIPLIIIAVTQMIKMALPQINGFVTVLVALAVGLVVALIDTAIGVRDITIAEGLINALGAVGITAIASKAGGGAPGDGTHTTYQR